MRAADYDDWVTPTIVKDGKQMHGLNGDILVWNDVTHRRHELTSMGIRVTKETLIEQLKITGQEDFLTMPYHQMIMNDQIPLSVGGGLGQSRIYGWLLNKAALGECSVTVWPQQLHEICEDHNIHLLR
jgi:aspartate--ammonia ligase